MPAVDGLGVKSSWMLIYDEMLLKSNGKTISDVTALFTKVDGFLEVYSPPKEEDTLIPAGNVVFLPSKYNLNCFFLISGICHFLSYFS